MKTAADALRQESSKLKLTTGSAELDSLIDGIKQGQIYLFYSNDQKALDLLIHRVLVNCVLPIENGGFNSKALYFNICNYHRGKTILNPSKLAMIAKCAGIDPSIVFQNIYSVSAFNEMQQSTAAKEVVEFVKKDKNISLIAVHNLTRFIETSKQPRNARQVLKQIVGSLKNIASENNAALVLSCNALTTSLGRIPKPMGGTYLRHEANIIVLFNSLRRKAMPSFKATLVKHPYKKTPRSTRLYAPKGGVTLMGRITPSFRQQFHQLIDNLKKSSGFQHTLINLEHKKAFDLLLEEAWSAESAAMSRSGIPCILDIANLMANIHNKKCNEELKRKLAELERILHNFKKSSKT